jgi:NADPH2:quinone reductase
MGTAGIPPREVLTDALAQVMNHAADGQLRVDIERVALSDVERWWERNVPGRRLIVIP